jgi:hypothetical protein
MDTRAALAEGDVPYFCWDRPWTVAEIRRRLAAAQGVERDRLTAWIMREAAFKDVWLFLTPAEVRDALPRVSPMLGRWRAFWPYLIGRWHELGKV